MLTTHDDRRSTMFVAPDDVASTKHHSRLLVGLLIITFGMAGALRTFDAVQLSATHIAFLAVMVFGAAVTAPSLAIARR